MYVLVRGTENARRNTASRVASVLERCVAETEMTSAFIAMERNIAGRPTLSVRSRYARDAQPGQWRLSSDMRAALHRAIVSVSPVIISGQRRSRSVGLPRVLIAVPLISDGQCFGALAAIGYIPAPYVNALRTIRRLAAMLDVGGYLATIDQLSPADVMGSASARQDVLLHELRVPLSAASLLLESMMSLAGPPRHVGSDDTRLRDAYRAILDAQSIVRRLSQVQALEQDAHPITLRPVQVGTLLDRAMALLPGSKGCLRCDISDTLPAVAADPLWLTHVMTNLLENAMTHAPAAHAVTVAVAPNAENTRVVISITSYGTGIPPSEQAALLHPYRRHATRDDLTSKGLGLSIAQYLVAEMRGELSLRSDSRHSATFSISLPVTSNR